MSSAPLYVNRRRRPPRAPSAARPADPGPNATAGGAASRAPPPPPPPPAPQSGYYLSELLYQGRSADEIFAVESPAARRAKYGGRLRAARLGILEETRRLLRDDDDAQDRSRVCGGEEPHVDDGDSSSRFRRLQARLRATHCVTHARLREDLARLLLAGDIEDGLAVGDDRAYDAEGRDEGTPRGPRHKEAAAARAPAASVGAGL